MISTEERYLISTNSTNLRVEAEKQGDGDVMIASGWAPNRIGSALMRLRTKQTRALLSDVHTQTTMEAERLRIENPDKVARVVLSWWIDNGCKTCSGRKFDSIENTPSLSAVECPKCHGTGIKELPFGRVGQRLADWLDACKHSHVGMIKRRLRPE